MPLSAYSRLVEPSRGKPQIGYDVRVASASLPIRVNRAPVLTLWATVVAERLGHSLSTALTLGRFVAGSSARAKARRLGIADEVQDAADRQA